MRSLVKEALLVGVSTCAVLLGALLVTEHASHIALTVPSQVANTVGALEARDAVFPEATSMVGGVSSEERVSVSEATTPAPENIDVSSTQERSVPVSPKTPGAVGQKYLSTEEAEALLRLQNAVRERVGVAPLTWSSYLAQSAENWADTLASRGCVMEHSESGYGENIYYGRRYGSLLTPRTPQEVVAAFTDEKDDYSYAENSCRNDHICGHYTQIVWANTARVGCAKSLCLAENDREEIWVCHYDPPGNVTGLAPY